MIPTPDVLLVEDNASDVAVALRAFRRGALESRVGVLRDGEQVLDWLDRLGEGDGQGAGNGRGVRMPKVILLDLRMPKVDGWEVLRALRSHEATRLVPVVVVSSSDREGDVQEAYRLGANSFVKKRFDPGRPGGYLVDAARYWLELNRPPADGGEEKGWLTPSR